MKIRKYLVVIMVIAVLGVYASAEAKTLKLSWDPSDANYGAETYIFYWAYNLADVVNGTISPAIQTSKLCYCFEASEYFPAVYFGLTAVDDRGMKSETVLGYKLFGNVNGDVEFNVGVPWGDTKVDYGDSTLIRANLNTKVVHGFLNCDSCTYTGAWPPTTAERCDLNDDGNVNTIDFFEWGPRFGNAAQRP